MNDDFRGGVVLIRYAAPENCSSSLSIAGSPGKRIDLGNDSRDAGAGSVWRRLGGAYRFAGITNNPFREFEIRGKAAKG